MSIELLFQTSLMPTRAAARVRCPRRLPRESDAHAACHASQMPHAAGPRLSGARLRGRGLQVDTWTEPATLHCRSAQDWASSTGMPSPGQGPRWATSCAILPISAAALIYQGASKTTYPPASPITETSSTHCGGGCRATSRPSAASATTSPIVQPSSATRRSLFTCPLSRITTTSPGLGYRRPVRCRREGRRSPTGCRSGAG
jgi:hypothetical protein